ncbi:extracellular solute-binding protein [Paenibacillus albicereus]|uniref:Extracellular solute-binding protein n=1 Tax=Paenibacillus albicereus TaxID=2726185 RepID=A0A6H2GYD9_9BACL|nr:extracellular solute-binding protein [Paenibacillus albicereus]QJC52451.1 extracellular solute-binding protein [Paenibacillus albicereus]
MKELGETTVVKKKGTRLRAAGLAAMAATLAAGALAGCSGSSSEQSEQSVLRIGMLYGSADNESWFRQQYTDTFEFTHPNVNLEIVYANNYNDMRYSNGEDQKEQPDPYDKMKELLTGKNPVDVVMVDYYQLQRMTQDGLLQQLDPLIAKDKFDISDYVPTVIDGIKAAGDSKIYVLTPTFSGSALFYNKKIFSDAGVQPPTDKMTWNQVFDLARKVKGGTGEKQVFGLTLNRWSGGDAFNDIQTYVAPLQLKMYDDKGEKMLVDSGPAWSNAWDTFLKLYKEDVLPTQEKIQKINEAQQKAREKDKSISSYPNQGDLFSSGNVAMTIGDYNYIMELKNMKDAAATNKSMKAIDWDVVTVPVFEEHPDVGGNSYLGQPMGINAKAQNPEGAWEFIKFLNGREWAKLKSRSTYEIPSRAEFIKPIDGMQYNIKAFYTLKPVPPTSSALEALARSKPGIYEVFSLGQQSFQQALSGKMTAEEAVKDWATKGNALLAKLKTNPKGEQGGSTEGGAVEVLPAG